MENVAAAPTPRTFTKRRDMEHTSETAPRERRAFAPRTITVRLQPKEQLLTMPREKTVLQVLRKLGIRPTTAIVVRDGGLLTPDREVLPDDELLIRIVTSSG
ncbi:hypothetical protein DA2_2756 [Desulfovibrio sp. A2]|nr:hypothetical protein DA2_2756 [Desulfovibrio sp. A2]